MPRAEAGTPKAIANKIKAKGLQKLKWYCQMCEKQCRDENGFKCHCESEGHLRQMELFAATPGRFTNDFSHQFEKGFMDLVRRMYQNKRVLANRVYNEYISEKDHVHMNSTQWQSLSGFVKYLGRAGKCAVEESPKGWYITFINQDPKEIAKRRQLQEMKDSTSELDEETRTRMALESRINAIKELEMKRNQQQSTSEEIVEQNAEEETEKESEEERKIEETRGSGWVSISLMQTKTEEEGDDDGKGKSNANSASVFTNITEEPETKRQKLIETSRNTTEGIRILDQIRHETEQKQKMKIPTTRSTTITTTTKATTKEEEEEEKKGEKSWICVGIIVRVIAEGDKLHKRKGVIKKIIDNGNGIQLAMIDDNTKQVVDKNEIETVIPSIGGRVRILFPHELSGQIAILDSISIDSYSASIHLENDSSKTISSIDYSQISKIP